MNFEKKINFLGSRTALNIYFWLMLFLLKQQDAYQQHGYPVIFYYGIMLLLASFLIALTCINNFILYPRLWFRKKRWQHIVAALSLVVAITLIYVFILNWLQAAFPGLDAVSLSMVMHPITNEVSLNAIATDFESYFPFMLLWVIIFTPLSHIHYSSKISREKIRIMEEAINKHRETELAFLRNQVNPHFLFNTLNNLYALSLKKADQTPESILKLSTVLRYILYESNADLVSFSTEKDIMQSYIDIELLRIDSPQFNFSITTDKIYKIPPLIWLPILENVFKHTRMVENLEVDFRFSIVKDQLTVYCRNNMAVKEKTGEKEGGIGLANLKKRLELLYPGKHSFESYIEGNYFTARVQINLSQT